MDTDQKKINQKSDGIRIEHNQNQKYNKLSNYNIKIKWNTYQKQTKLIH